MHQIQYQVLPVLYSYMMRGFDCWSALQVKGLAIEEAPLVFKKHWFWKRYANHEEPSEVRR